MNDLFDPAAIRRQRRRADPLGPADVLHRLAADEIKDRLGEVNRTFTDAVLIGWQGALWSEALDLPQARCIPDAPVLDLEAAQADLVIHALCLHWAADPVGQLVQMRRALRPDGLALAIFFGGESLWELRTALTEAEVAITGGLSPRISPMADLRAAGALLQRAGLALPVADAFRVQLVYPSPLHLMRDLRAMGEGNALSDRPRTPLRRDILMRAAAIYQERFGLPDGTVPATAEFLVLTGWAPSEDQQKPLRPGSAAQLLADALNTQEQPAGDRPPPQRR